MGDGAQATGFGVKKVRFVHGSSGTLLFHFSPTTSPTHPFRELHHVGLGERRCDLIGRLRGVEKPAQVVVQVLEHQRHRRKASRRGVAVDDHLDQVHDVLVRSLVAGVHVRT